MEVTSMGVMKNWITKHKEMQKKQEFQKIFSERKMIVQREIMNDTKAKIDGLQQVEALQKLYDIKNINDRWQFIDQTPYFDNWKSTSYQRDFLKSIVEDDSKLKAYLLRSQDDYLKRKSRLELKIAISNFMRPNTEKDIQERKDALNNVTKSIQQTDKTNQLNLRFHSNHFPVSDFISKNKIFIHPVST